MRLELIEYAMVSFETSMPTAIFSKNPVASAISDTIIGIHLKVPLCGRGAAVSGLTMLLLSWAAFSSPKA